jgi:chitinase
MIGLSQNPNPALIGYFHNWQNLNAPYIQLDQIDSRYNIIDVAFAVPIFGTDYNMQFVPDQVSPTTFMSQIQTLHAQGRKVIISIGGATAPISLDNSMERDSFIVSMTNIINTYDFDGIDIDFEGGSLSVNGGTISSPVDQPVINLIYAIKEIMTNYYLQNNRRLILTMAPETAYVQGGQSAYAGIWGAYLPIIDALRDSLEILHVQLYNSGSMNGIDGNIYTQGTADFIVAMCEAVIQGFNTPGGMFTGLPANKIAVGLPACSMAAGGGYTDTATVKAAIDYLRGNGNQPGSYTLINPTGYPDLRGMMTWSVNWDAISNCGASYEYANNYQNIFGQSTVNPTWDCVNGSCIDLGSGTGAYNDSLICISNCSAVVDWWCIGGVAGYLCIQSATQPIGTLVSGPYNDSLVCATNCISTNIFDHENISNRKLIKVINVLGEEIYNKRNTLLFYIYDDGTVEKRITIE